MLDDGIVVVQVVMAHVVGVMVVMAVWVTCGCDDSVSGCDGCDGCDDSTGDYDSCDGCESNVGCDGSVGDCGDCDRGVAAVTVITVIVIVAVSNSLVSTKTGSLSAPGFT